MMAENKDDDDENDDEEENLFYDDFADFGTIGCGSSSSSPSSTLLQERIRQVQTTETQKESMLNRNWRSGVWQVRGFSLDPDSAADDIYDDSIARTHVCHLSPDYSSSSEQSVWVGRTNGEILRVQLGSDYWTHFSSKLTATMEESNTVTDDNEATNTNVQVSSQLVRQEMSIPAAAAADDDNGSDAVVPRLSPFEILDQFTAANAAIGTILSTESHLFTTSVDSGNIQQWLLTEEKEDGATKIVPLQSLEAHAGTVICLQTVYLTADSDDDDDNEEASVLFSASQDGTLALWDITSGDLLYKCQMMSADTDTPVTIECADASGPNVFCGTSDGHVWAYNVRDWVKAAADGVQSSCPLPAGQWTASGTAITSISCAGEGSLGRGSGSPGSLLLLTGAADGVVKQWEVLSRSVASSSASDNTPMTRLEQWPKLPTQRLPKKAHLFQGHDMEVSAILPVDATKFLSASKDGTVRAWNPATGKELFRMDGFTEALHSLCLQDDMLITDGMKQFVCVHDFDIDPDEDGFELDYFDEE